jgi:8-oxo-dGTP diphosphatase
MISMIDKVAWIHIEDRKVLFVRSAGKTAFFTPGGKREAGESDLQTLTREVKEELGVDILPNTVKYVDTFKAEAGNPPVKDLWVQIKCYTAEYSGRLQVNSEIEELGWFWSGTDGQYITSVGALLLKSLKEQDLID